jgi:hypothetical protein
MRIFGYVLLVVGVVFALLFALAQFGGGHLGVVPFFVSFMLIVMGWQMGTAGKGILRTSPAPKPDLGSAQPATGPGQSGAAADQMSTVELPLTPEVAAALALHSARSRRILLMISGGLFVLIAGLGAAIAATDTTPGEGRTFLVVLGGVGVACALLIYGISWLTTLAPVRSDLRGTSYLRTTGPVQVVPMFGGAMLRLADRAFLMNGHGGAAQLRKLGWGKVDYSPHGHVVLGAWDREGRSVYCLPGYAPSGGTNGP